MNSLDLSMKIGMSDTFLFIPSFKMDIEKMARLAEKTLGLTDKTFI